MTLPRDINYTMDQLIARRPFGETNPVFDDILAPTNQLLLGATGRTDTSSGKTATVKAGEDIRPALNSLKAAGGGTLILLAGIHKPTYDIVGDSKINIIGEGIDQTIIDFEGGNYNIYYDGTTSIKTNFTLKEFTIKNSIKSTAGLSLLKCDNFTLDFIKIDFCSGEGILITTCNNFKIFNSVFTSNTKSGVHITAVTLDTSNFSITTCSSNSNTVNGFRFTVNAAVISNFSISFCTASSNTGDNYSFESSDNIAYGIVTGCFASSTNNWNFDINAQAMTFIGCTTGSGSNGMRTSSTCTAIVIIGCHAADYNLQGEVLSLGNSISDYVNLVGGSSGIPADEFDSLFDKQSVVLSTLNASLTTEREVIQVQNTSGSTLTQGDTVVYAANSEGDEITTTTTQGDDYVLGMVITSSVVNNDFASVLVKGKTKVLKVDGTTDIAVGDFLCTYTTAGIAAKAGAGDMAFAIALETYTTDDSNGVIDALLISPRKI